MKKLMNESMVLVSMFAILFMACSKESPQPQPDPEPEPDPIEEPGVTEPSFDVQDYQVQQVTDPSSGEEVFQVTFSVAGESDDINFYSGQFGNDYQYRDGRLVDYDQLNISFDTRVNSSGAQENLSVHVSTDFDGDYTFARVSEANWTEIEDFTLATTTTWVESGIKNIVGRKEEGKPLYIAFKYTYFAQPPAPAPRLWRINSFAFSGITVLGESLIADQDSPEWTLVSNAIDDVPITRSRIGENGGSRMNSIMLQFGNNVDNQHIGHDTWVVSKAFELDAIDYGPDEAVPVKQIADPQLTTYQYNYTEEGTYEVVFVAKNIGDNGEEKEVVRTIQVTIP